MTWSDVFPILTDELYDDYLASASKKARKEAETWFSEQRTINPRDVGHIVSVSLFWKNIRSEQPDIVIRNRADFMSAGKRRKLLRFEPWSHYVAPLLEGSYRLHASRSDVAFRVYLASDLEFLIPDLVEAGCEVRLMKSSSLRHNPGAMWRFLAFGDTGKLVTVVDADRARLVELDVARTEAMAQSGLNWWRVPVWGELNEVGNVSYRPFIGLQMGSRGELKEIRTIMEALVWATQNGKIETFAKLPGCAPKPVHGTVWPDYGFDEWFLLSAVYPRASYDGVLTFVPSDAKSRLLALDVQYTSKANERSEIHYFGSVGGGCCAPPAAPSGPTNQKVLLTGIWQLATANDLALILDMWEHIHAQDMPVTVKPVLHVKSRPLLRKLPAALRDAAVLWEGLGYSVSVQGGLTDAIINGHEADWVWKCDSDERADFAVAGGLRVVMQKAERLNADYVPGHWIDRVAPDQLLPAIKAGSTLADQFPIPALLTKYFQGSVDKKVALHRRTCPTGGANHEPHDKQKVPSPFQVPIWHFKWNSDCKQNQLTKIAADSHQLWIREWVQTISRFDEADGVLRGPWNGLPKAAWPRLPKKYGSGRYPFRTE